VSGFHLQVDPGEGTEDAALLNDLVGSDASESIRSVRSENKQRNSRLVGFHYSRKKIGHRGSRRRYDSSGNTRRLANAKSDETRNSFIDPNMKTKLTPLLCCRQR
jgi:hypothetical protein